MFGELQVVAKAWVSMESKLLAFILADYSGISKIVEDEKSCRLVAKAFRINRSKYRISNSGTS